MIAQRIDLNKICKDYGIRVIAYKNVPEIVKRNGINPHENAGLAFKLSDGTRVIFYDSNLPALEVRFIVAHEIGHHLLGHLDYRQVNGEIPDFAESEANHFAVCLFAHDIICKYGVMDAAHKE